MDGKITENLGFKSLLQKVIFFGTFRHASSNSSFYLAEPARVKVSLLAIHTVKHFIALRWLHSLIGPLNSPKTLKRVKTLDKSLPNHVLLFNILGQFLGSKPPFLVMNTNCPGSNLNNPPQGADSAHHCNKIFHVVTSHQTIVIQASVMSNN